jgi:hypothetical protein
MPYTRKSLRSQGGAGADVVLEVAGVSDAFIQGVQLVRTCGGPPGDDPQGFEVKVKIISITNSFPGIVLDGNDEIF